MADKLSGGLGLRDFQVGLLSGFLELLLRFPAAIELGEVLKEGFGDGVAIETSGCQIARLRGVLGQLAGDPVLNFLTTALCWRQLFPLLAVKGPYKPHCDGHVALVILVTWRGERVKTDQRS